MAQAHPNRVKDMLAYMNFIIREATNFGGLGWRTYDTVFQRNQDGSPSPWNVTDPSLHISYTAGHETPPLPPADTAMRQTTTAMAEQWHLSQCTQRALLIRSKNGSFPCRKEGSPPLINSTLPGSACRGIRENEPFLIHVPSVTHVQCVKGVTK